jgi:hypothetical protein
VKELLSTSYVGNITESKIEVVCADPLAVRTVRSLGGRQALLFFGGWSLHYSSKRELAAHLAALRDARFAMAGGPAGWPPAAIFEEIRAEGKLVGTFVEICWLGSGETMLTEK